MAIYRHNYAKLEIRLSNIIDTIIDELLKMRYTA